MLARQAEPGPMTFEEYLDWEAMQEEKWELVGGYPVRRSDRWSYDPTTGMAGATLAHNLIVANLIRHLGNRLAGGPCRPLPSDIKFQSEDGNSRYPDVTVSCRLTAMNSLTVAEPRVLFEVLSPSNSFAQQIQLLEDYQATTAVEQIVWLEQHRASALLWTRNKDGWRRSTLEGVHATLELASISIALPLAEVYQDVIFSDEPSPAANARRPA